MTTIIETRNGPRELLSRPWWTSHAVSTAHGVVVCRAESRSLTDKYPSPEDLEADPELSKYMIGPDYHGKHVEGSIDLTEDQVRAHGLNVGILDFPHIVDGPRPRSNNTSKPVTEAVRQRVYDLLQNEGCIEDEDAPFEPRHKGDEYNN